MAPGYLRFPGRRPLRAAANHREPHVGGGPELPDGCAVHPPGRRKRGGGDAGGAGAGRAGRDCKAHQPRGGSQSRAVYAATVEHGGDQGPLRRRPRLRHQRPAGQAKHGRDLPSGSQAHWARQRGVWTLVEHHGGRAGFERVRRLNNMRVGRGEGGGQGRGRADRNVQGARGRSRGCGVACAEEQHLRVCRRRQAPPHLGRSRGGQEARAVCDGPRGGDQLPRVQPLQHKPHRHWLCGQDGGGVGPAQHGGAPPLVRHPRRRRHQRGMELPLRDGAGLVQR
mmetsp:Transcript_35276/g.83541  ORF Transcript_35276/g.83541 Transcript_35276/m.83541 type:complete len:281 (-) Transcript_35276:589-1431(-)